MSTEGEGFVAIVTGLSVNLRIRRIVVNSSLSHNIVAAFVGNSPRERITIHIVAKVECLHLNAGAYRDRSSGSCGSVSVVRERYIVVGACPYTGHVSRTSTLEENIVFSALSILLCENLGVKLLVFNRLGLAVGAILIVLPPYSPSDFNSLLGVNVFVFDRILVVNGQNIGGQALEVARGGGGLGPRTSI